MQPAIFLLRSSAMTMPQALQVSALRSAPGFAQGLVRDVRVRWALEEAGLPYEQRLVTPDVQKSRDYRAVHPFGQVPALEGDVVPMFESGAIVLHIAEQSEALMPHDDASRQLVKSWIFAALNTVEPVVTAYQLIELQPDEVKEGTGKLREAVTKLIEERLDDLSRYLGEKRYLVADRFTAADLLMTSVLRALRNTDLLATRASLRAYKGMHEARPAFQRALAAQMKVFEANAANGGDGLGVEPSSA
jgi:glutathione S-transferase